MVLTCFLSRTFLSEIIWHLWNHLIQLIVRHLDINNPKYGLSSVAWSQMDGQDGQIMFSIILIFEDVREPLKSTEVWFLTKLFGPVCRLWSKIIFLQNDLFLVMKATN